MSARVYILAGHYREAVMLADACHIPQPRWRLVRDAHSLWGTRRAVVLETWCWQHIWPPLDRLRILDALRGCGADRWAVPCPGEPEHFPRWLAVDWPEIQRARMLRLGTDEGSEHAA